MFFEYFEFSSTLISNGRCLHVSDYWKISPVYVLDMRCCNVVHLLAIQDDEMSRTPLNMAVVFLGNDGKKSEYHNLAMGPGIYF
jgi:hypothetical protein